MLPLGDTGSPQPPHCGPRISMDQTYGTAFDRAVPSLPLSIMGHSGEQGTVAGANSGSVGLWLCARSSHPVQDPTTGSPVAFEQHAK